MQGCGSRAAIPLRAAAACEKLLAQGALVRGRDLLVQEKARDRLEAQRASDRAAMTADTVAKVLGTKVLGTKVLGTKVLDIKVLGTNGRREQFQRG
jgi:hypothetical protein